MVEDRTGKCKFFHVANRDRETLIPIIRQFIGQGATVYLDIWRSWWILGSEGHIHRMVNHASNFVDRNTDVNTNTTE